jgi:DNA replication protein DnaC
MSSQALSPQSQEALQRKNEESWKKSSYKCHECKDTGWILTSHENSAPSAGICECRKREKVKNQWSALGLNPENSTQTFSNFKVWNESSRKARDTAAAYYKEFANIRKSRQNSILFCGQVGSGKSHLSIALALNFIKNNIKVVYMPYRDVITQIKQNMLDEEYYRKVISKYQTCDVLLMDDLFKGKINESDINIVFEIINYRYLNHLPIIASTEYTTEKLLTFDEGIGSRIYEMCKNYTVEIEKSRENNYRLK